MRPNWKHVNIKFKKQLKGTVGVSGLQGSARAFNPSRPFFSNSSFFSSGSVTSNKRSVLSNHALPSSCHLLSTQTPFRLLSPRRSPGALEKSFSAWLYSTPTSAAPSLSTATHHRTAAALCKSNVTTMLEMCLCPYSKNKKGRKSVSLCACF